MSLLMGIASDDPQCSTPKSRKNESYNQSHLAPPSASPGAHAQHDDYDMSSPTWPRTPASPVSNLTAIVSPRVPLSFPFFVYNFTARPCIAHTFTAL